MALVVYVDESGDLGWTFTSPFRSGGSSRFLTIASVCVDAEKKHLPKRLVRDLYKKSSWPPSVEKKWSSMDDKERTEFATAAHNLCKGNPHINLHSITVRKQNVQNHIRTDGNKLYNYMIRLSLLQRMSLHESVVMIPDPRSIKVESGNSLSDYLQIGLWFDLKCKTMIRMQPIESHLSLGLQFTDMLCGAIQSGFEDGNYKYFQIISPCLQLKRLYFG
jgi:Protein of unknown function (DUF3800)